MLGLDSIYYYLCFNQYKNDMEQQTAETLLFFAIPIILLFCLVILIDYLGKKFEDI